MSDTPISNNFVDQAESIILDNVSNEQFGVSELADAMHTSRSNLLRKIKKDTKLSASQFIRQVRLEKGMEMLAQTTFTVSEVSFKVGFGSTSYFIKCFREYYGYPPGEVVRKSMQSGQGSSSARQRQLVAIMFTDIQGYTALMQKDEGRAIAYRDRHREVFDSTTKKYNGRILQYYGDGTLSTFPSAIDAVHCGLEMQLAFTEEEPNIPIRIGIHSGDILVSDQDIIGDGVNVAARIEALSKAGTVYISDKVYDEIKNQPDFLTVSRGVHTLKNVTKPTEVYQVTNQRLGGIDASSPVPSLKKAKSRSVVLGSLVAAVVILLAYFAFTGFFGGKADSGSMADVVDKSIAVFPFKNESSDSSNLYFVNGLMESTLSKLQKVKDLRVISRSSMERYRQTDKSIPEIAEELKVHYFVSGSGQKADDQVLLNIQLIEASSGEQIWVEQYSRELVDIFKLQNEVALKIVGSIEAIVTPAELEQLEKRPTENLLAYDYYMQALDPFSSRTNEGLVKAIGLFEKAIEEDPEFALAYANIAISYYLLEMQHVEKENTEKINNYADKALLYDSKLAESLIAKAFYYIQTKEFHLALPHLEKALEYNPNSSFAVHMLADFYSRLDPDSNKYLEYALKGVQLNVASDSVTQSYTSLQLSLALVTAGFLDEALEYVNMSLDYFEGNYYAPHLKIIIRFAMDGDADQTTNLLVREWEKDTTRLDILQDVAKFYYVQEKYDSAYVYFEKFIAIMKGNGLAIPWQETIKIARVYQKMGFEKEAEQFFSEFASLCEEDQTSYRSANLALKYAYEGNNGQVIEQLKVFSEIENFQYWYLLIEDEPLLKPLKNDPEFERLIQKIKDRFWENQARLQESLEEEGLI